MYNKFLITINILLILALFVIHNPPTILGFATLVLAAWNIENATRNKDGIHSVQARRIENIVGGMLLIIVIGVLILWMHCGPLGEKCN